MRKKRQLYKRSSIIQIIYNDYPDYPALATIKVQDFNYDEQGKISLIHVSYQNKNDQSDLEYTYSYR